MHRSIKKFIADYLNLERPIEIVVNCNMRKEERNLFNW
jgi:hypothetical protein